MARDKKGKDGRVPFVLAPRIGEFRIVYDVSPADIRAAIASLAS
jgi:3-dehydroquinate synthetase